MSRCPPSQPRRLRSLTSTLFDIGNGGSGAFGSERHPETINRGVSNIVANVSDGLANGSLSPKTYRRQACKNLTAGHGMVRDAEGFMTESRDTVMLDSRAREAEAVLDRVIAKGKRNATDPARVTKSFSGYLSGAINGMNRLSPQNMGMSQMAAAWSKQISKAIGKNFSLASPLTSGFVPFDLMPFVRTIYPVYTPFRNKIPRVPGQGEFHRGKILASITGSLPGGLGALQNDATSEFFGGSFSSWPNPLPPAGVQTAYDVIIPYKFFALTEGTSWLSQFAGQGFDDLYGLASLVLLQEFMLCEEHDLLASTSQNYAQPAAPTATARAAGSNETALTFTGTDLWIIVTAINYWGETPFNAANITEVTTATTGVSVVDVTIAPVTGALAYRIYIGTGTSQPARTSFFLWTTNTQLSSAIGGIKFTLQGAVPTTGANPQSTDSGTGNANNQESLLSVISGQASTGTGPYPAGVNSGYFNNAVGQQNTIAVITNALQQMYNGNTGYLANPSEIVASPTDAKILADSIRNETVAAYQFRVQQSEVANVQAGIAVANMVNPITRSSPEILVHPYLTQGTEFFMSYTLPQTQNNLGNVVENVMVQDYAQIGWPVIDPTFRQSILRYGTFFAPAPQYLGAIQGLQVSATTPYS